MKNLIYLIFLISTTSNAAVSINHNGIGEVLLLPYFTVNNSLNTLVSVNNTSDTAKAIKIVFKDAVATDPVGSINVYLAPNDAWTWGMAASAEGAQVISFDQSCSPLFNSPLTLAQADASPVPPFEGSIEVYEMGSLDPDTGYGLDITFDGQNPINCQQIEDNWSATGNWSQTDGTAELLPASGGLTASVSLIDVANGINYTYDGIAIEGFYPDNSNFLHTAPNIDTLPSLKSANQVSSTLTQGEFFETEWPNGFEAISAVLAKRQLTVDYSIEAGINAQTEIILTFPTKGFHTESDAVIEPFNIPEFTFSQCDLYDTVIFNRDTRSVYYVPNDVTPVPSTFCSNTHVIKIWDFYNENTIYSPILESDYRLNQSATSNSAGLYELRFNQSTSRGQSLDGLETHTFFGLPVIGVALTNYVNNNAQPGLLAQYGGAFAIKSNNKAERQTLTQ